MGANTAKTQRRDSTLLFFHAFSCVGGNKQTRSHNQPPFPCLLLCTMSGGDGAWWRRGERRPRVDGALCPAQDPPCWPIAEQPASVVAPPLHRLPRAHNPVPHSPSSAKPAAASPADATPPPPPTDDTPPVDPASGDGPPPTDAEDEECGFCVFMKGGGCKAAFEAWAACVDAARGDGGDFAETCRVATLELQACMERNPAYYGDFIVRDESGEGGEGVKEGDGGASGGGQEAASEGR